MPVASRLTQLARLRLGLVLALALGLAGEGLVRSRELFEKEGRTLPFWAGSRYDELRRLVADAPRVGFGTDLLDRRGNLRIMATQYAVAPSLVVHDYALAAVGRRLLQGYTVVCDYGDPAALDEALGFVETWCAGEGLRVEVFRLRSDLAVVRSPGR